MGVDVTALDGIDVITGQVFLSVIRHLKADGRNRLANALRMAAQSLCRSDSYLGARYRSLRGRLGGQRANKAMARYLACLLCRLLTQGQAYVDRGAAHYERQRQHRERSQKATVGNRSSSRLD